MSISTGKRTYFYVVSKDNEVVKIKYGSSVKFSGEVHIFHTLIQAVEFATMRKAKEC